MQPSWRVLGLCRRHMSAAAASPAATPPYFRTPTSDPLQHSPDDFGRLYTMEADQQKRLFQVTGLRKPLASQARTFCELSLMVRKPALDVVTCLRALPATAPSARFVLYGPYGAGKTVTVLHALDWAAAAGWVVVHLPEADRWGHRFREVQPSSADPRLIDHPLDAAAWLTHFRSQSGAQLASLGLTTSQQYTWSKRELTEQGAPLADVVELGVARVKHASQCMHALLAELKQHATEGRCRVLMAVEKVNAFWTDSAVRREDRTPVPFADFTVVRAAQQLLAADWSGGAVLATVAPVRGGQADSYLPRHSLGEDGWRALDPFVPIRVDNMSRSETYSMIDYYCERRWLQAAVSGTEEGKKELFFRSGGNSGKLAELCSVY